MEIRMINGSKPMIEELLTNLFVPVCTNAEGITMGIEQAGSDEDGYCIKVDMSVLTDAQIMVIESSMYSRIQSGLMTANDWECDEDILKNSFALTANSNDKLEIILKDILAGAKVNENNICIVQQPFAPGMYKTLVTVVIAFNLNQDQMKAVQLSTKVAKQGIKVTNFTKKARMVGGTVANVTNRVGKEVTLAGVEIGATIGVGAVKTGVEAGACIANIAIKELNHKELMKGDNVQSLMKTVKGLWGKQESDTITKGFGAL